MSRSATVFGALARSCARSLAPLALALALIGPADPAAAQSDVRPPSDAVNVEAQGAASDMGGDEGQLTPGATSVRQPDPSGNRTDEVYMGANPAPQGFNPAVRPPADAANPLPQQPGVPREVIFRQGQIDPAAPLGLEAQGPNSSSDMWSAIREGQQGSVPQPDKRMGVMIQPIQSHSWGAWRDQGGPLQVWGLIAVGGMTGLLIVFFLIRGRVRIRQGKSDILIERFKGIERFFHWVLAVSFILLALTGLNLLYGKDFLMPVMGKEAYATLAGWGKYVHDNIAWAFMLALVAVFVMWVVHNIPGWIDVKWLAKGGGIVGNSHPHARKFNAGQKIVFWATVLLGASVSLTGLALLFPFELPMFAKTFAVLNSLGAEAVWGRPLPTDLTMMEEQQYAQLWHTIVGIAMMAIVIGHIYIGTIGMEGAFAAMGRGWVDRNWAEEHHDLWVEKKDRQAEDGRAGRPRSAIQPAE